MSAQQDGGGRSESLSIEETNKLRAKLNLKPLEVEDSSGKGTEEKQDVHAPAKNILDEQHSKKIKSKMERVRMMRETHQSLSSVKTLGRKGGDADDDVGSWLKKSRKIDEEKRKAEQKQRELDAMDEEFGVSAMLDKEMSKKNKGKKGRGEDYSSADLRGLTVEHDEGAFVDGTTTILTLKDQDVLGEGDDVLVNVNLMDLERAKKNIENKKRKPEYRPWEEDELDEHGMARPKAVLSKYDEELNGEEKKLFTLGDRGTADLSDTMVREMIKKDMAARAQTLDYSRGELAREYYTNDEMTAFKKPKKKRKVKKKMLKADDLLRMGHEEEDTEVPSKSSRDQKPHLSAAPVNIKKEPEASGETKLSDEEDDDSELRIALARTRRLRQMERRRSPSPVQATQVKMEVDSDEDEDDDSRGVSFAGAVMSTTSEFCRTVGTEDASPTHRSAPVATESDDDDDDMDIEEEELPGDATGAAGWSQVDPRQKRKEKVEVKQELEYSDILEDEPIVSSSLAATLQMADQKGFLEQAKFKRQREKGVSHQLVGSAAEMDAKARNRAGEIRERERRERDRDHDRDRRDYDRDRDRNPLEKPGYKPKVNLEYADASGRLLNEKEAFRQLSWGFHGKLPGKAKTAKRKKKLEEEEKMLKMSSTDTPLATRALLEDKLKVTKSPFLVLSGSAQRSLTANTITKN